MTLDQLSIRIQKADLTKIKSKVKNGQYDSISEFIRLAISEKLKIYDCDFIFDGFVLKKRSLESDINA